MAQCRACGDSASHFEDGPLCHTCFTYVPCHLCVKLIKFTASTGFLGHTVCLPCKQQAEASGLQVLPPWDPNVVLEVPKE